FLERHHLATEGREHLVDPARFDDRLDRRLRVARKAIEEPANRADDLLDRGRLGRRMSAERFAKILHGLQRFPYVVREQRDELDALVVAATCRRVGLRRAVLVVEVPDGEDDEGALLGRHGTPAGRGRETRAVAVGTHHGTTQALARGRYERPAREPFGNQKLERLILQLLAAIAEEVLGAGIDIGDRSVGAGDDDGVRCPVEEEGRLVRDHRCPDALILVDLTYSSRMAQKVTAIENSRCANRY